MNKHQKDITYEIGNLIWLSSFNIKINKPSKKLNNK